MARHAITHHIEADSLLALLEALLLIVQERGPDEEEEAVIVNHHLLLQVRQAMLMVADAIERRTGMSPRTSELRRAAKGR